MTQIKNIYLRIVFALAIFSLAGCSDYLDKEYDASLSEDKIFANSTLTKEYLANLYTFLPDGFGPFSDTQFLNASRDCMTDNAIAYWGLIYYNKIRTDSYTSSSHPLTDSFWTNNFTAIRRCNKFLSRISSNVISNASAGGDDNRLFTRYKAEARLLRAMYHFELVAYFGAAPILDGKIFDVDDPEMLNLTRDKPAAVLEWIASECDSVKNVLPFRYTSDGNWGRVTGATAYALKSRALLYRASALNNVASSTQWWADAAQAAKDFIDANTAFSTPHKLFTYEGTPSGVSLPSDIVNAKKGTLNYMYCFVTLPYNNDEVIMARSVWSTYIIDFSFLPFGSFSNTYGRTNPTQNLVDAYETINGKTIADDPSYNKQDPYANRDPRLEATIFHHGSVWGRPDYGEQKTVDVHYNSETDKGVDYRGSSGGTYTGYYVKKFVNPNIIFNTSYLSAQSHSWIIYRYAEILLNYAEALNESQGPVSAAYNAINQVRARAGLPDLPANLTQAQFRSRIRNERRVELAFEDHRFFDLRRWKLYYDQTSANETSLPYSQQIYNIYGVKVTTSASKPVYTYGKDDNVGDVVYSTPKNDLFPIPYAEYTKVPSLGQNTGW
jgi:hypothetical protein